MVGRVQGPVRATRNHVAIDHALREQTKEIPILQGLASPVFVVSYSWEGCYGEHPGSLLGDLGGNCSGREWSRLSASGRRTLPDNQASRNIPGRVSLRLSSRGCYDPSGIINSGTSGILRKTDVTSWSMLETTLNEVCRSCGVVIAVQEGRHRCLQPKDDRVAVAGADGREPHVELGGIRGFELRFLERRVREHDVVAG